LRLELLRSHTLVLKLEVVRFGRDKRLASSPKPPDRFLELSEPAILYVPEAVYPEVKRRHDWRRRQSEKLREQEWRG
jgi:hypothetical protein